MGCVYTVAGLGMCLIGSTTGCTDSNPGILPNIVQYIKSIKNQGRVKEPWEQKNEDVVADWLCKPRRWARRRICGTGIGSFQLFLYTTRTGWVTVEYRSS